MNKILREIFVMRSTIKESISYVQATNAIPIIFIFRDWTIPVGAVAKVYVTKPSGKGTYNIANIEGNTVLIEPKDQTFAEAGTSTLQIQIVAGGKTLVSFAVPVIVEKNNVAGDVPESENQSNFIDEYLTDIKTAIGNAENATTLASNTAKGIQHKLDSGELTGSLTVGTVKTGQAGEPASVINKGTKKDAIFDITIPRGETGTIGKIEMSTAETHQLFTVESAAVLKELPGKTVQGDNPSPTNPQPIKGIGSRGWFDGELLQGFHDLTTGIFTINARNVCNKNMIPCKKGDSITFIYGDRIEYIMLVFYDKSGKFVRSITGSRGVQELSYNNIAEDNICYVNFNIQNTAAITPQTAKHITIFKNGKYCALIRSIGENLCNPSEFDIGSVGNLGELNTNSARLRSGYIPTNGKRTFCYFRNNSSDYQVISKQYYDKNFTYLGSVPAIETTAIYTVYLFKNKTDTANTVTNLNELKNLVTITSDKLDKFIPYTESNIQVPLDEPLWSNGKIEMRNGQYGVYQEYKEIVLDASVDEVWETYTGSAVCFFTQSVISDRTELKMLCDKFKNMPNCWTPVNENLIGVFSQVPSENSIFFKPPNDSVTTLAQFKTWLQSNPITLVYKLVAPQFIPFESKVQKLFYDLRSYKDHTTVSIVDELQTTFTIEYASNNTGDYVLSGYTKAQMLDSAAADPYEIGLATEAKDGLMSKDAFQQQKKNTSDISIKLDKISADKLYKPIEYIPSELGYIKIARGTDLNTIVKNGLYLCEDNATGSTLLNSPVASAFSMLVMRDVLGSTGNGMTQVVFAISTGYIFVRNMYSVNTRSWVRIYNGRDLPYGIETQNKQFGIIADSVNEINFVGTTTTGAEAESIYFGYRSVSGRPSPLKYVFGGRDNKYAELHCGNVFVNGTNISDKYQPKMLLIKVPKTMLTASCFYDDGVVTALVNLNAARSIGIKNSVYADWRKVLMLQDCFLIFGTETQFNQSQVRLGDGRITKFGGGTASGFEISAKLTKNGFAEISVMVGSTGDTNCANYKSQVEEMYVVCSMIADYTSFVGVDVSAN